MTHTAENRVIVLNPTHNQNSKSKTPIYSRGILIAPSEWMYRVEKLKVPGHGLLSNNFDTIAAVNSQPDNGIKSRHDVILQINDVYSPHVILLAVSQEFGFEYNTLQDGVIGGIEVERAYYYYDLLPESQMLNKLLTNSPTTLEGFLGLISWHTDPPLKKR